jgi:hypothetical protein
MPSLHAPLLMIGPALWCRTRPGACPDLGWQPRLHGEHGRKGNNVCRRLLVSLPRPPLQCMARRRSRRWRTLRGQSTKRRGLSTIKDFEFRPKSGSSSGSSRTKPISFFCCLGRLINVLMVRPCIRAFSKSLECSRLDVCGVSSLFRRSLIFWTIDFCVGKFNAANISLTISGIIALRRSIWR